MDGAEAGEKIFLKNNLQKYLFHFSQKVNFNSENNLKVDSNGSVKGEKIF